MKVTQSDNGILIRLTNTEAAQLALVLADTPAEAITVGLFTELDRLGFSKTPSS